MTTAIDEKEEFEFLYQMEQDAKAGIPPPNPAPVKASMGDVIAGTPLARLGMGLASPLIGAAQIGAHVGDVANRAMGVEPMVSPWIDKKLSEYEAAKQRGMKASGTEGFDAMGLIGSLLPGSSIAKGVTAALPAAKNIGGRILQGAGIGAATSAAQPVVNSPEFWSDKGKQAGIGAVTGAAVPAVAEALRAARGMPQLNPVKAQTLKEGQAAGYVVPPSTVNPSFLTNRLESVAGKAAVGQEAAKRNQEVTNALAAKSLGLPKETTLTPEVLSEFRTQQGKVYEQVAALSDTAKTALNELKQARHDSKVQWNFYNRSGNPEALATAKNADAMAEMFTDELGTEATKVGRSDLIQSLTDARTKIAKSFDVSRALNASSGEVNAPTLGKIFAKRGDKAMTGELATIGKMAGAFKGSMREGGNVPVSGVSGTDAAASALLGVAGAAGGGPMGLLAGGLPLLRGPARNLVLSKAYQNFATSDPSKYQALIDALSQRGAGAAGTIAGRGVQP
jgi:hypothetical protein